MFVVFARPKAKLLLFSAFSYTLTNISTFFSSKPFNDPCLLSFFKSFLEKVVCFVFASFFKEKCPIGLMYRWTSLYARDRYSNYRLAYIEFIYKKTKNNFKFDDRFQKTKVISQSNIREIADKMVAFNKCLLRSISSTLNVCILRTNFFDKAKT